MYNFSDTDDDAGEFRGVSAKCPICRKNNWSVSPFEYGCRHLVGYVSSGGSELGVLGSSDSLTKLLKEVNAFLLTLSPSQYAECLPILEDSHVMAACFKKREPHSDLTSYVVVDRICLNLVQEYPLVKEETASESMGWWMDLYFARNSKKFDAYMAAAQSLYEDKLRQVFERVQQQVASS